MNTPKIVPVQVSPARRIKYNRLNPLAMALSMSFLALPAFAADGSSDDERSEIQFESEQVGLFAFSPTNLALQTRLHPSQTASMSSGLAKAANGNGGFFLCPSGTGRGRTFGYNSSATMSCPAGDGFSLHNGAQNNGIYEFDTSARVFGSPDGRLLLKGIAGVNFLGAVTFNSTVAVSGKQITELSGGATDDMAAHLGQLRPVLDTMNAGIGADGTVTAPRFNVQGSNRTSVGAALTALDTATSATTTDLTQLNDTVSKGEVGLVQQTAAGADITVANALGGTAVDLSGSGGARLLKGMTAGSVAVGSSEAITGSQLFDTNTRLSATGSDLGDLRNAYNSFTTNFAGTAGAAGALQYDDAIAQDRVTVGGATVSNLQTGALSSTSSDAVTGAQLFATDQNVQTLTSDVDVMEATVTSTDTAVTNVQTQLSNGGIGLVQYDAATGIASISAALGGDLIDVTGSAGERRVTGVAQGVSGQDAVNMEQMKLLGLTDPNDGRAKGALIYDDLSLDRVTLGGASGTVLDHVANGLLASGSREAVNGGQLHDVQQNLQAQLDDMDTSVGDIEQAWADGELSPADAGTGIAKADAAGSTRSGGFDAGGNPVQNVGDGVADTDAVNVRQMDETLENINHHTDQRFNAMQDTFDAFREDLDNRFNALDDRLDRMGAMAGAYAGMAQNTAGLPGRNRLGMGFGGQGGKIALAAGYQRVLGLRGNLSLSLGGALSGSEASLSGGFGVTW